MHTACREVMRPTSPTLSSKNKVGYHIVLCSQPKKKGAASQLLQLQAINRCIKYSPKQVQPAWCSSQDGPTLNRNIQATQINSDQLRSTQPEGWVQLHWGLGETYCCWEWGSCEHMFGSTEMMQALAELKLHKRSFLQSGEPCPNTQSQLQSYHSCTIPQPC